MPFPRLIVVEGLPGSGKSTTAQQVWLRLEAQGRPARWWFEHEQGHPIFDDEAVRRARAAAPEEEGGIFPRALDGWRALVQRLQAGDETVVLESTVFQTTVGTQLLQDVARSVITEHFRRTAEILAPLAPALVRLRPADPAAAMARTCARRHPWFEPFLREQFAASARGRRIGAEWTAVAAYFVEREETCDELARNWPGPQLVHDNSDGDWLRQRQAVGDFLGLAPGRPAPLVGAPADFTGHYRADTGDAWEVAADERGLYLADEARTRLLPHGPDLFVIEGLCVELAFERGGPGSARAIRCRGALPGLAPHWSRVSS